MKRSTLLPCIALAAAAILTGCDKKAPNPSKAPNPDPPRRNNPSTPRNPSIPSNPTPPR
jgi:hypothetical protein